jgi:hypothetical protein
MAFPILSFLEPSFTFSLSKSVQTLPCHILLMSALPIPLLPLLQFPHQKNKDDSSFILIGRTDNKVPSAIQGRFDKQMAAIIASIISLVTRI